MAMNRSGNHFSSEAERGTTTVAASVICSAQCIPLKLVVQPCGCQGAQGGELRKDGGAAEDGIERFLLKCASESQVPNCFAA